MTPVMAVEDEDVDASLLATFISVTTSISCVLIMWGSVSPAAMLRPLVTEPRIARGPTDAQFPTALRGGGASGSEVLPKVRSLSSWL